MQPESSSRQPSRIDELANRYVDVIASLDPVEATSMGLPGYDHLMSDYSPEVTAEQAQRASEIMAMINDTPPVDDVDVVTVAAMNERLSRQVELFDAGELDGVLNNIASPLQAMRDVFDLMPTDTTEQWEAIASRLRQIPQSMQSYRESLDHAAARGKVPALRQVRIGIDQAEDIAAASGFFANFATRARTASGPLSPALMTELSTVTQNARAAYGSLADYLVTTLAPTAPADDAFGRDRYTLWSRYFLGASIDLDETYEWGLAELDAVIAEQEACAALIGGPGTRIPDAVAKLDADPNRHLQGAEALQAWMQSTVNQAMSELAGTHFDIPDAARIIECRIAPTHSGGIYYTGPSDDFSRPGRMWWSVPSGITDFTTWREKTTVYHEGVPGHHLQIAQTVYRRSTLNRWRRLASWTSGYGEGWALYAERLMADLGYLADPGDRLGMLDGQRMRAARVVLDIGVHLRKPCPEQWGGGTWDAAKAWDFFLDNVMQAPEFSRFEVDRYLGWAGQAPSYKVGQRLWERSRDEARARAESRGKAFSLKDFHRRALNLGAIGLDVMRDALQSADER